MCHACNFSRVLIPAAHAAKTGEEKKTLVQTNAFFESVFAFTLSKNRLDPTLSQTRDGLKLLLLEGMASDDGSNQMLTPQLMGQALTERLMVGAFRYTHKSYHPPREQ